MDIEASRRIRNPFLQTVYEHHTNPIWDRQRLTQQFPVEKWYSCDIQQFPEHLQHLFIQCCLDNQTEVFLDKSYEKSDWFFTQMWHSLAKVFLGFVMSTTSVNGLLGRGSMFVFSTNQFRTLLGISETWKADHLLDLGAGDGAVTQQIAAHFRQITTTEMSPTMQWRLGQKGYRVVNINEWAGPTCRYDVISCLNLIDRCDQPISILHDIHRSLSPGGMAIISLVLPFKPFVESGALQNKPSEQLNIEGRSWEHQAASFINNVLLPAGFTLQSFTRLPYLCEGDMSRPFYSLDDAVFIVKADSTGIEHQGWCNARTQDSIDL
ncbi:protein-L-histidine N-pros-methyltransferase-like isoform X2 [Amphiura filiformis]